MKKALPGTPEYKWPASQRAKFRATMKAKRANPSPTQMPRVWGANGKGESVHDAIIFLRHAESKAVQRLREGKIKQFDESHLLAMQALRTLEGNK